MTKQSSLERKMLSYFGLIAAASLLITIEFMYAIQTAAPDIQALCQPGASPPDVMSSIAPALASLREKAALMFAVQVIVTLIVLIMFMRRITGPLQHMVETSRVISDGDLSRTVQIRTKDEIGLLGETINGLTSNIQEIVAFGMSTEASLRSDLQALRACTSDDPSCRERLDEMDIALDGFRDIVNSFKLFPDPLSERVEGPEA
jgi:methyl-accepting chemotaxis protein